MPPPKPSVEGARDRQVRHEIRQIVRAVGDLGPVSPDRLAEAVGARYWEDGRFDRAVAYAVTDGVVVRDAEGLLQKL
jgi:hypothetical protein